MGDLDGDHREPQVLRRFHGAAQWGELVPKAIRGRAFALCVATYCAGRLWIELLRTDTAEHFLGLRLNVFTSIIVGLLAVAYLVWQRGRSRETISRGTSPEPAEGEPQAVPADAEQQPRSSDT